MTNRKNAVPVAVSTIQIMFLLMTGVAFGVAQTASQPVVEPGQKMTNATVVQMMQAKISPDLIILSISKCEPHFQLDPANAQYMLQIGVTEEIYKAMAARQMGQPIPGFTQPSATTAPAVSQPSQSPADSSTTFQHKGSKEIGLQFTGVISHAAPSIVVHDGTPVRLRLNRNLSSADAKVGDTADFEVLEDVKVGDTLVIARGGMAIATVTQAQSKRRMARGGKLDVNIDYVRLVNDEKIALRAVKETKGGGHTGAMTGAIVATSLVFFPAAPFFLFMHGKDITIPKGTEITGYVQGDVTLDATKLVAKTGNAQPALVAPAEARSPAPTLSGNAMTNQDVIALKSAGLSDELVVAKINRAPAEYKLDTEDLIALKQANLSEPVIQAMIEAQARAR